MRYAIIAVVLGLAACSSGSDTGTGASSGSTGIGTSAGNGGATGLTTGGSTGASTGATTGGSTSATTGATTSTSGASTGGTTATNGFGTLSGPTAFSPASVFFEYNRYDDAGIDKHEAFVVLSQQHFVCRDFYADAGTHVTQPVAEVAVVFPEDGGAFVHSGSYPVDTGALFGQPSPNGSGVVLEFSPLPDGGLTFDQLLISSSGTVTLSSFSDTHASGSFTAQLAYSDGGNAGTLSGSFDAPACY